MPLPRPPAIDFLATQVQFADHLRPIYEALPEEVRGEFFDGKTIPPYRHLANGGQAKRRQLPSMCVVSAIGDLKKVAVRRRPIIVGGTVLRYQPWVPTVLFEHGAGFSFHGSGNTNASYAGGIERNGALALPATNDYVARANREAYPHVPSPIVGCPKLDALVRIPAPVNERPVVCVSFHWDCHVCPETRWAFSHFGAAVANLKGRPEFELVAHGHPRMRSFWRKWYGTHGIEFIEDFEDVVRRADVYVNDSSSTLYEFAAMGRPVVVMNSPHYRRHIHHGLRFWEHSDVGYNADTPAQLLPAIKRALKDPPAQQARRAAAVEAVYPYLGESVPRAAQLLLDLLQQETR